MWSNGFYWIIVLLASVISLLPYFLIRYIQVQIFPNTFNIISEIQKEDLKIPKRKLKKLKKRRGVTITFEPIEEDVYRGYAFDHPGPLTMSNKVENSN